VEGSASKERIIRWQNKRDGAVLDDVAPSLRASGGTDIRKKPYVLHTNKSQTVTPHEEACALRRGASHNYQVVVESGLIHSRGLETRGDGVSHSLKGGGGGSSKNFVVSGRTRSTGTPARSTARTSGAKNSSRATLEKWVPGASPTTTSSQQGSHARLSQLLASGVDLKTRGGLSSLRSLGFSRKKDPDIFYSKTSRVCLVTDMAKLSRRYLGFSPTLGIYCNGRYSILSTSGCRRTGSGSSLSDILETDVPEKYFLSKKQTAYLMKNLAEGKESHLVSTQTTGKEQGGNEPS